jgi:DNA mismatch repair protein MutL
LTDPRIRVLDDSVINKIAAGEVVERPASVVKELLENAIDAEASRVEVDVEGGGRTGITVSDDGIGMSRDDALLALRRHATSKIRSDADLFSVHTLGFRGEAIPSIASVSRLELLTGQPDQDAGTRIVVDGGQVGRVEDAPNPGGTEIKVGRLFFNTPVRAKFLKSPRTEMSHLTEAAHRIALACPHVAVKLRSDGRTLLDAPPSAELGPRVAAVLGRKAAAGMRPLQAVRGDLRLEGLISEPSLHRSAASGLYLYVNGRFVKDRTLVGAVLSAYRGIVPRGRYPLAVLFLDLPTERVDVNVHPTKVEVRFQQSGEIWRFVGASLNDAISGMGAGGELPEARPEPSGPIWSGRAPRLPLGRSLASRAMDRAVPGSDPAGGAPDPLGRAAAPSVHEGKACSGRAASWMDRLDRAVERGDAWGTGRARPRFSELEFLGQFDRTFLLCQAGRELVVLDQHAAHERVIFERLRSSAGRAPIQRLLVPELLELDRDRTAAIAEVLPLLHGLGVEMSVFGEDTVALQGVPLGLAPARLRRAILDLAEEVLTGAGRERRVVEALRYEIAALVACHSAVRAQDSLSADEARTLLVQLDRIEHAFACPHGRPTVVRFPRDEVARWFVRDS